MKTFLKICLLAIIPLAILGFSIFEKTEIYSSIFKFRGVELAVAERLTTNFGDPKQLIISRQNNPREFDDLWNLIKKNTKHPLPNWTPKVISRFAVENGTAVTLPVNGKVILVPRNIPVVALKVPYSGVSKGKPGKEDSFIVGTVSDIERWLQGERANVRFIFDILIASFSVILGLLVEFKLKNWGESMKQDNTYEILKVFYDEMIKHGTTHKCIMIDIDDKFLKTLKTNSKIKISIEEAREVIDKCIANEWIEHGVMGNQYGGLQLTTSGLGLVKSKLQKIEESANRTLLKKVSDFVDEHKGVFVLLSFIISAFSLLVAIFALYISYTKGN